VVKAIVFVGWAIFNALTIVLYMGSIFLFVVNSMDVLQQLLSKR